METTNQNTKDVLQLNLIKLTPKIIDKINHLQTGGLTNSELITDKSFDNTGLKSRFDILDDLRDFFIWIYKTDQIEDAEIVMEFLCSIEYIREDFNAFKVPLITNRQFNKSKFRTEFNNS